MMLLQIVQLSIGVTPSFVILPFLMLLFDLMIRVQHPDEQQRHREKCSAEQPPDHAPTPCSFQRSISHGVLAIMLTRHR